MNNDKSVVFFDIDIEKAIIGSMILERDCQKDIIANYSEKLSATEFYSKQFQKVFGTICHMTESNIPVDTISVISQLRAENKLENDDITVISESTDFAQSEGNIESNVLKLRNYAAKRSLFKISLEIKDSLKEEVDAENIIEKLEQSLSKVENPLANVEIKNDEYIFGVMYQEMLRRTSLSKEKGLVGITTGFYNVDLITSGFFPEFTVIGARASIGKTAFMLSMINIIAYKERIPCGLFSLEMSDIEIRERFVSMQANVESSALRKASFTASQLQRIDDANKKNYGAPFYVVDEPNLDFAKIKNLARKMVREKDVKIIFIDYIGLITIKGMGFNVPVYERISYITKQLKQLTRELKIPIVAACQLGRNAEGAMPNLSDLRGSGSVEEDADNVFLIHRDRESEQVVQDVEFKIQKNRHGECKTLKLQFIKPTMQFRDWQDINGNKEG